MFLFLTKLLRKRDINRDDVQGGLVGCLESVFYSAPYNSDVDTAKIANGHPGHRLAMSANSMLTGALEDLKKESLEKAAYKNCEAFMK